MKRDPNTLDMFTEWTPPKVAENLPPETARGGNVSTRIARAISHALKEAEISRDEVAGRMSAYLGQQITKNMLDAYASQAREDHKITFERLIALIEATGEMGLLGFAAEMFGLIVVPEKYKDIIELHFIEEQQKRLELRRSQSIAKLRAGQ